MILSFTLSMPNCNSWNGKWSGEGRKHVILKRFTTKKAIVKALKILQEKYFHYSWSDGWAAGITVKEVDTKEARQLRKQSSGFCGYDWMVDTILMYGKPMADHQVKEFLVKKNEVKNVVDCSPVS